jgi:molecular chaperone GrpE (heat shock protein)
MDNKTDDKMDKLESDITEIKIHLAHIDEKIENINKIREESNESSHWWIYILIILGSNIGSLLLGIFK